MTKIWRNLCVVLLINFCLFLDIDGQDLHYSQFYNSPINVNPALTGIFNGDKRFIANFRDQWRSVPVPWLTFSGAYDQKIYPKGNTKGFFGLGVLFNYDRQGDSKLNLTNINVTGSYTRKLNKNNLITFGLLAGFSSRGFNTDGLTWDKQWDQDRFNPGSPSGETFDLLRVNFLETGTGINYRWQQSSRTKLDLGVGAYHFIKPSPNYYNEEDLALPIRLSLSGVGNIQLGSKIDIQLHGLHQIQSEYSETVFGGLLKFYLSNKRGEETEIHIGAGYRTSEALFPTFALKYKNIYASISYDIDQSDFSFVTNNKGGPEIHFRYTISEVKPLSKFKVCPIY